MKLRIRKENLMLVLCALLLLTSVSSFFGYWGERLVHSYFKYAVGLFVIAVMCLCLWNSMNIRKSGRKAYLLQYASIFLAIYAAMYLIQHQMLEDNRGKAFGLSSYTILGIQNIAVFLSGYYVILRGSKRFCRNLCYVFMGITIADCIVSLGILAINNQALRIASWQGGDNVLADQGIFGAINALNVYSYVVMLPLLLMLAKQKGFIRYAAFATLAIVLFMLMNAGYTMAIFITVAYVSYKIFCRMTPKVALRALGMFVVIVILLIVDWGAVLLFFSERVGNASIKERLLDIYKILSSGEQGAAIGSRITAYTKGLEGFLQSPVIGNVVFNTRQISGHSTLIDILSSWGIVGLFMYVMFLNCMYKAGICDVEKRSRQYGTEAYMLYLMTILINVVGRYANGSAVMMMMLPAALKALDGITEQ